MSDSDRKGQTRKSQAAIMRAKSAEDREIGPPKKPKKPARRKRSERSFRLFCEQYLPERFPLAWSDDHLKAIAKIETAVLTGGRFAFAMPRGSGKTTLCEAAAIWAIVFGHRRFILLIGSTESAAEELLESIKVELETNDLLDEDFNEVTHPIRCLEGIANRCKGQTINGERTRIEWTQKAIVMPTVAKSKASGAILKVAGITGRIRGMKRGSLRPDLVIPDDPQTDESAHSPSQNTYREGILAGAVMGLAGPKKKIAVCMPCTVIAPGDMADRSLDRDRHPEWNGERSKLIYAFPTNEQAWDHYAMLRKDGMRSGDGGRAATEYYRANQGDMDAGAVVGWRERFNPDELSAVQYAMNLKIDSPSAFAAEYQNEPLDLTGQNALAELTPDVVVAKINQIPMGIVPRQCSRLTAGIDVQGNMLFWLVAAWDEKFGGSIVDYGSFPKQNKAYFRAAEAKPDLEAMYPNMVDTARIYRGLMELTGWLLSRRFEQAETGANLSIERCLVDSGDFTDTVYQFCRESPHSSVLNPSKGYGLSAGKVRVSEWSLKEGEKSGWNWRMRAPDKGRGRLVMIDSNIWKSFVYERLSVPMATPGCLSLNGKESYVHQLLADHLTSESRERTDGRGLTIYEWTRKPNRENHWWDCLNYAAVAASVLGIEFSASGQPRSSEQRKPVSFSEMQRLAKERRGKKK